MSWKLEPAIWPCDTGQRIPCFIDCNMIVQYQRSTQQTKGLCLSQPLFWSMAAMLRDSAVVCVRPRAIPLAMITMRKSTHGFPFLLHDDYGAPLGGPSGRQSSVPHYSGPFAVINFIFLMRASCKISSTLQIKVSYTSVQVMYMYIISNYN